MRQQLNELSGYLDMGLIYGNSEAHFEALRSKKGKKYIPYRPTLGTAKLLHQTLVASKK